MIPHDSPCFRESSSPRTIRLVDYIYDDSHIDTHTLYFLGLFLDICLRVSMSPWESCPTCPTSHVWRGVDVSQKRGIMRNHAESCGNHEKCLSGSRHKQWLKQKHSLLAMLLKQPTRLRAG